MFFGGFRKLLKFWENKAKWTKCNHRRSRWWTRRRRRLSISSPQSRFRRYNSQVQPLAYFDCRRDFFFCVFVCTYMYIEKYLRKTFKKHEFTWISMKLLCFLDLLAGFFLSLSFSFGRFKIICVSIIVPVLCRL